jgi:hypothetical protein
MAVHTLQYSFRTHTHHSWYIRRTVRRVFPSLSTEVTAVLPAGLLQLFVLRRRLRSVAAKTLLNLLAPEFF